MEENEEFDSDFNSEDIPISEEFWNYMEHYWHNNREFPESTETSLNKKADLVDGKVPSSQLPSYVDDILEFDTFQNLPNPGEKGKIYIITNDNSQFRWSGSEYIQLNSDEYFMTTNTYQDINGQKIFYTTGGNLFSNNKLWVSSYDGSFPGITFQRGGYNIAALNYDGGIFHFNNNAVDSQYGLVKAAGFYKNGSDNNHVLLGNGSDRDINDFVTNDSGNNIFGKKWFKTDGGNTWDNNTVRIQGINGYNAGLTFYRDGIDVGQIIYNGYSFQTQTSDGLGYIPIKSSKFIKEGSDQNHVLLGDGEHKPISDFASSSQLGNYLPLSGGTLTGGGKVKSNGDIVLKQTTTGVNATGLFWEKLNNSAIMAGVGTLTEGDFVQHSYMGWGEFPWDSGTSLAVSEYYLTYKNQNIWHTGNFNPNTKINALENARAVGFSSGSYPTQNGIEYPYIYFDNGTVTGYVSLATQDWVNYTFAKKSDLGNYVAKSGDVMTGGLIISTPDSIGSNDLGTLPQNLKLFLSNGNSLPNNGYGTAFWTEGSGQGYIQQQRADGSPIAYRLNLQPYGGELYYGNSEVAKKSDLGDYVTINTPQTIIANKNFAPTSIITFTGVDSNTVQSFTKTNGVTGIVAGWLYRHYANFWKVGHKRGNSDNSLGYAFEFSNDNGATYNEKVIIEPNSNIVTASFGSADQWKLAFDRGDFRDYGLGVDSVPYTGDLNNLNKTSFYKFDDVSSNRPFSYGTILNQQFASGEQTQLAIGLFGNGISTRGKSNGQGWTNWQNHWHSGNFNPANYPMTNQVIQVDSAGSIINGSDTRTNKVWFDYDWAGTGRAGSVLNFSGLAGGYSTEIFAHYGASNEIGFRTRNGDTNIWGNPQLLWHNGNFTPSEYWKINDTINYLDANYLKLAGGTLAGGGKINSNGDITLKQNSIGGNATGIWWDDNVINDRLGGIGALTNNGALNHLYIGWGTTPWDAETSLAVSNNILRYKNQDIWHSGNFNPNTKANALELATGVGMSDEDTPYIVHSTAGAIYLATKEYASNVANNRVISENNAKALGFVAGTPNTPYIKHSDGTSINLATEKWSSNNFVTLSSDQNIDGRKRFANPIRLPGATNSDEAVNLGQTLELVENRTNSKFLTRTTNGSNDYDLVEYGRPQITNIVCKGNGGYSLDINHFEPGMTVKVSNTTDNIIYINFNGGATSAIVEKISWAEFHLDSDGDIIKTDAIQAKII